MNPAIQLAGVSKRYHISYDKPALVRQILPRMIRPRTVMEHWALHPLDLEVAKGRSLGIIGLNGAGKTTLLSLMAGIAQPTTGSVSVTGKVASLMSVGSGFHPELTGRENIFLNGTLLGMTTREIRGRMDSILRFARLDRFIDAPLATYSAGMQLRLGFSVAMHTQSDILLMDEVLAVGDIEFEKRCLAELKRLREEGKILVFVTQNLGLLEGLCDRALLLHRGREVEFGNPRRVVRAYHHLSEQAGKGRSFWLPFERRAFVKRQSTYSSRRIEKEWQRRFKRREARILGLRYLDKRGRPISEIKAGDALQIEASLEFLEPVRDPHIGIALYRSDRTYVFGPNTRFDNYRFERVTPGKGRCTIRLDSVPLSTGEYRASVAIWERQERFHYSYDCAYYPLRVKGRPPEVSGLLAAPCRWQAERPAVRRRKRIGRTVQDAYVEKVHRVRTSSHMARPLSNGISMDISRASASLHESDLLHYGHPVEFIVSFSDQRPSQGNQVWIGVARDPDGLLCAGWSTWEEGVAFSWPAGSSRIRLRIAKWPLTAGRYRVGCAVWNTQGALEHWNARHMSVTVAPGHPDHGLIYLPHQWSIKLPNGQ